MAFSLFCHLSMYSSDGAGGEGTCILGVFGNGPSRLPVYCHFTVTDGVKF